MEREHEFLAATTLKEARLAELNTAGTNKPRVTSQGRPKVFGTLLGEEDDYGDEEDELMQIRAMA